jgi:hypothetical protein
MTGIANGIVTGQQRFHNFILWPAMKAPAPCIRLSLKYLGTLLIGSGAAPWAILRAEKKRLN